MCACVRFFDPGQIFLIGDPFALSPIFGGVACPARSSGERGGLAIYTFRKKVRQRKTFLSKPFKDQGFASVSRKYHGEGVLHIAKANFCTIGWSNALLADANLDCCPCDCRALRYNLNNSKKRI